jgi:predicted nucleic acid-binding protein
MIDCVVDASVLVKLVVDEPDASATVAYLGRREVGAPGIAIAETANVLRRLVKSRKFTSEQAHAALETIVDKTDLLPETAAETRLTLDLAVALDHPAQDCRYLAAAIARKVPLITADDGFVRKARAAGHDARALAESITPGG